MHEEFKQNIENVSVEMLLRKFAESKGTGREKPGEPGAGEVGCGPGCREGTGLRRQESQPRWASVSSSGKWADGRSNSTAQQEEGLMPDLVCESLATRYQKGLECQAQLFWLYPDGPREPLRVVEQMAHLKRPTCRVWEE